MYAPPDRWTTSVGMNTARLTCWKVFWRRNNTFFSSAFSWLTVRKKSTSPRVTGSVSFNGVCGWWENWDFLQREFLLSSQGANLKPLVNGGKCLISSFKGKTMKECALICRRRWYSLHVLTQRELKHSVRPWWVTEWNSKYTSLFHSTSHYFYV